jgi:hypothetical protein
LSIKPRGSDDEVAPAEKPAAEQAEGPKITRDPQGNAVIAISAEALREMEIQVANLTATQLSPEVKGYGRVVDPAPLAALMTELASAQAAYSASSNELARLAMLEAQGNASTRAMQTAQAAALRDQLSIQAARDRFALSWGKAIAARTNLPAFIQSLASLDSVLVRIDLPAGEAMEAPATARMVTLAGAVCDSEFLGPAPGVDPQMQGRGFFFQISSNAQRLSPGEALVGYLQAQGDPLSGVVVPREAVVRTEGAGWVYVQSRKDADAFTRTEIPLDHPTAAGWFVAKGVTASDRVVAKGAQQLLSIESRGQGGEE